MKTRNEICQDLRDGKITLHGALRNLSPHCIAGWAFDKLKEAENYTQAYQLAKFGINCVYWGHEPRQFSHGIETKPAKAQQEHHYKYIPLDTGWFLSILAAQPLRGGKFLDVGCGIGDKVVLAHELGFKGRGIEFTPQTYWIGKFFIDDYYDFAIGRLNWEEQKKALTPTLILGDATEYDYSDEDLIYLYCPIAGGPAAKRLYRRIFKTMKRGAIVVEAYPCGEFKFVCHEMGLRYDRSKLVENAGVRFIRKNRTNDKLRFFYPQRIKWPDHWPFPKGR